jgi:signal transduction histidine kinase
MMTSLIEKLNRYSIQVRHIDQYNREEFSNAQDLHYWRQLIYDIFCLINHPFRNTSGHFGVITDTAQQGQYDDFRAHLSHNRNKTPAIMYFIFLNLVWSGWLVPVTTETTLVSESSWNPVVVLPSAILGLIAIFLGWIAFLSIVCKSLRDEVQIIPNKFNDYERSLSMWISIGESCLRIHFICIVLSLGLMTRTGQISDGATIFVISLAHIGQICLDLPFTVTMVSLICGVSTTCFLTTPINTCDAALRTFSCVFSIILIYCHEIGLRDSFAKWSEISNKYDSAQVAANVEATSAARNLGELRLIIGNTAHDLKTPLQAFIFSTAELIESLKKIQEIGCVDGDKHSFDESRNHLVLSAIESAQNLMTYSEFMNMSINRSLDFTKSTFGVCLSPTYTSFNLFDAIKYPVECIRAIQVRMTIVLELDTPENDQVITDEHWLKDNLICLLSNAVKYSIDGDVRLRCKIVINSNNDGLPEEFIRFEVEDHGIGVTEAHREKLFQPFARTQNQAGGTGLGLYSLSKRIQALGGHFGIEGRSDGTSGSLVWFTFPYRRDIMQDFDVKETSPLSSQGSSDITDMIEPSSRIDVRERILIVDDSPMIIKMLKRSLEAASYEVVVAENGAEAYERFNENETNFDAIVTDIQMPVRSLCNYAHSITANDYGLSMFRLWMESS